MPKTISFHNGTDWSRGHNIRDERYTAKQGHIDKSLKNQNVILQDIPVRQAYNEIFGKAVKEYNERQKRTDRKITDYYEKIKADKRKHPVYECIVQIGNRNDTGNSAELEKQALIKFVENWKDRNPNLKLIGAYIHADEPDGTVHLHLDYIPVAKCNKGMNIQNSFDRALQQQGFHSENIHKTAQIEWQENEREVLANICRQLNIDAQHTQGITKNRGHLTKREYIQEKENILQDTKTELQLIQQQVQQEQQKLNSLQGSVLEQSEINALKGKKSITGALRGVTYEEYLSLKKTASQIEILKQDKKKLQITNKDLTTKMNKLENKINMTNEVLKSKGIELDLDKEIKELKKIRNSPNKEVEEKKKEEPTKARFSIADLHSLHSDKYAPRSQKTENDLKRKKNQELEL